MRKPSDLKVFVNSQIKYWAEAYHKVKMSPDPMSDAIMRQKAETLNCIDARLEILFAIQKICETRKKY